MNTCDVEATNQLGENGAVEYTAAGVRSRRVALFFALVRGMEELDINSHVMDCIKEFDMLPSAVDRAAALADLFVITFQTRNCRGGKGEKKLFDRLFLKLFTMFPSTCEKLVPLIPRYGSYKDYFRLLDTMGNLPMYDGLRSAIITKVAKQLLTDGRRLAASKIAPVASTEGAIDTSAAPAAPALSLCAKYAPREGAAIVRSIQGKAWFRQLRETMFPSAGNNKAEYRKLVSKLTAALGVPEVKMSANKFRDIDFGRVPSLCLNRCRKAFLNEPLERVGIRSSFLGARAPRMTACRVAFRHPDNEDRQQCRQNLLEATGSKHIHGKQLHPHSIVEEILSDSAATTAELSIFNVQWEKIRDDLLRSMERIQREQQRNATKPPIDFTKLVPLVDVSGSMHGDPMHAAIAMGILVSEVNHACFRNRFITFHDDPSWVDLSHCTQLCDKVYAASEAPWGGSTDILKAFRLIAKVVEENRLPAEEVPDLIIFSDMQFDEACGSSDTHLFIIQKIFADVGIAVCGKPYNIPRIVFWNLRAVAGGGYPATADDENVQMLSGFSPSMLVAVLAGEPIESDEPEHVPADSSDSEDHSIAVTAAAPAPTKQSVTPYQTLRKVLDNSRYDAVREILSQSNEQLLEHYTFSSPEAVSIAATASAAASADVEA